jgi:hypothetical protein
MINLDTLVPAYSIQVVHGEPEVVIVNLRKSGGRKEDIVSYSLLRSRRKRGHAGGSKDKGRRKGEGRRYEFREKETPLDTFYMKGCVYFFEKRDLSGYLKDFGDEIGLNELCLPGEFLLTILVCTYDCYKLCRYS